jgi:polyhydroxyalkanoate synthesis regulator phasin
MSSKKKIVAVAVTAVALSLGTVGLSTANAAKSNVSATKSANAGVANPMAGNAANGPEADFKTVLSGLVTKGTITQAQADAVLAALVAARPAHDDRGGARPDKATMDAHRAAVEALVASTIGVDAATIKTRLAAGETLAAIAGAKKDALITALVAYETKEIDARVTAGTMTAAQATTVKADLTAHITEEVNSVGGKAMGPKGDKGPKGHKGPKGPRS